MHKHRIASLLISLLNIYSCLIASDNGDRSRVDNLERVQEYAKTIGAGSNVGLGSIGFVVEKAGNAYPVVRRDVLSVVQESEVKVSAGYNRLSNDIRQAGQATAEVAKEVAPVVVAAMVAPAAAQLAIAGVKGLSHVYYSYNPTPQQQAEEREAIARADKAEIEAAQVMESGAFVKGKRDFRECILKNPACRRNSFGIPQKCISQARRFSSVGGDNEIPEMVSVLDKYPPSAEESGGEKRGCSIQ